MVPRPDASFVAVSLLSLTVYLMFRDLDPIVAGLPTSAINLAVATFVFAAISRNLILNYRIWQDRSRVTAGIVTAIGLPVVVFAILRASQQLID